MSNTHIVMVGVVLAVGAIARHADAADVTVNADKTYQTIEGFGTCTVGWRREFSKLYRTEKFQRFYVKEMGCSMLRVPLWGPISKEPVEDWKKISYRGFRYDARAQIYLDFAKAVKKMDPSIRLIATCWSPPPWMKVSKKLVGGKARGIRAGSYGGSKDRLDHKYMKHYAKWLVELAKQYKAAGAPLYAISPGNEIQFMEPYESCVWTAADFCKIVIELGEQLEAEGMKDVLVFGPETMTSHFYPGGTGDYIKAVADNPLAMKYLGRWATHGYYDGVVAEFKASHATKLHEAIKPYNKPVWMTESGTKGHKWPEPVRKGVATALHNGLVAGSFSAYLPWQIVEKKASTHALSTIDGPTKKTYAAMHFFKYIRPGAVRVNTNPAFGPIMVSAYMHAKNRNITVVAINASDKDRTVNLRFTGLRRVGPLSTWRTSATEDMKKLGDTPAPNRAATLAMPANSIVTLQGAAR